MRLLIWLLFSSTAIVLAASTMSADDRQVVGLLEKVRISPGDLVVIAKLDTGADHSSLHAVNIERFVRGGEKWVRFSVVNYKGQNVTLERKVVRESRIKRHKRRAPPRPVVKMGLCLGNVYRRALVNLVDRSRFRCRMIIGRSFMGDRLLVDPSKKFTVEPTCRHDAEQ
ncbi:MAG: ATP-dependent zinc protease [Deltaproteobacteria bacterium]